jgi:hypothetical protein
MRRCAGFGVVTVGFGADGMLIHALHGWAQPGRRKWVDEVGSTQRG